ncbi:MAG: alpha/beta fold hydrolase [Mailhella sp.]|nr:alpha/beta fold hydrolase [Mailhella sp.]
MSKPTRKTLPAAAAAALLFLSGCAASNHAPVMAVESQGSFFAGGTTITHDGEYVFADLWSQNGQTGYGDHAYVFYQTPPDARRYPLVFLHGGGQSKRTWETTPDGREGFQNIFLRRGFSTYLVDQPRRGEAGFSTVAPTEPVNPMCYDKTMFALFRLGTWPDLYPGSQFPKGSEALEQFYRQGTPNTGPLDYDVVADAMAAVFEKTGPGVLVGHSQGGGLAFLSALKSDKIRGIAAYEPGGSIRIFPEGEVPVPVKTSFGILEGTPVPESEFMKLTRIPIIIYFGDNIASEPTEDYGRDQWRGEVFMAKAFAEAINKRGGDCTVVCLPDIGITGNTHFLFADLNNVKIAELLSQWLHDKGLDAK